MTPAFRRFVDACEKRGVRAQWLTCDVWQITGRCRVEFHPHTQVMYAAGQKFYGCAERAIAFAILPPGVKQRARAA